MGYFKYSHATLNTVRNESCGPRKVRTGLKNSLSPSDTRAVAMSEWKAEPMFADVNNPVLL